MRPEIDHLVPRRVQPGGQFLLQCEPAVIGGDANAHGATFRLKLLLGFAAAPGRMSGDGL